MIVSYVFIGLITLLIWFVLEAIMLAVISINNGGSLPDLIKKIQEMKEHNKTKKKTAKSLLAEIRFILCIVFWPLFILYVVSSYIVNRKPFIVTLINRIMEEYEEEIKNE